MNHCKTGQDRSVDSLLLLTSAPLTHRTGLNVRWWCLALLFVLAPAPDGMAGDPASSDHSAQSTVTTPPKQPCLTAEQVDAVLGTALTGGSLADNKTPARPIDVGKAIGEVLGDQAKAAAEEGIRKGTEPFVGIRAKVEKENAERRTHNESLYQEFRRLAAEEKITPELRDLYAKEKIGPRLDTIRMSEINWQGRSADRDRVAGHVHAYVELVEIERQEREALKHHADTEKTCLQNWAIRVKQKAISKDKDYHVGTWEEERQICLAHFKKMFYQSPQYLKAQQFKNKIAAQQARATEIEQASKDCEGANALPIAPQR